MKKTPWAKVILELESRGWTPAQIARAHGATKQNLRDIKSGKSKNPCGMLAVRLHERGTAFGISFERA